ncbi:hypothetical protein FPS98_22475 [Brevibacillus brevis]|uniref:Syntaxin-5 N-terminal Sly1p-binding domain-containing protein n=1 Tax=Brevibacillus brevis TaxID=1393 RepID=A0A517IH27_BREBE|nr:hypothetical protein FPS98_22475 [Brevibacillus brevis]
MCQEFHSVVQSLQQ